jgi:DNA-binding MarR family transcriptional regulator
MNAVALRTEQTPVDPEYTEFYEVAYQLHQLARRQMAAALAVHNLTPAQYGVIKCINRHGTPITVASLAEATHQVMPTITGILNRLEERGLVIRRRSPTDRRSQLVSITPPAGTILKEFEHQRCQAMSAILSGLNPEERQLLLRLMRTLTTEFSANINATHRKDPGFEQDK